MPYFQNPTCEVTIAGHAIPQALIYVQTHKILTTMIGDCTINIANSLDTYPRTMFPPHSTISIKMNGAVVFTGHVTASESKYSKDSMETIVRGKDDMEDFMNTETRQAWVGHYLTSYTETLRLSDHTSYTDIASDIVDNVNSVQGTSYTKNIVGVSNATTIPTYHKYVNVDAFNALRDLTGVTIADHAIYGSNVIYDWFVDNNNVMYYFPRGFKPGARTIPITWGSGSTGNFLSVDFTDDVQKMKNDILIYGGKLQTPDPSVPNQDAWSAPIELEDKAPSSISSYGCRQDSSDQRQEKDATWLGTSIANTLAFENRIEERISCTIVGDPSALPGDWAVITTPFASINGAYYIYEVTQTFDGRSKTYTTTFSLGQDVLKFSASAARLQNQIDLLTQKLRYETKPNFSWSGTNVEWVSPTITDPSGTNYLYNPVYSLYQYDFATVAAFTLCNITAPPETFLVSGDYSEETHPIFNSTVKVIPPDVPPGIYALNHVSYSVAQKILLRNSTDSLTISVSLKKVGNPNDLYIALWDDSNNLPGKEVQSVQVLPPDIGTSYAYKDIDFTGLPTNTTYWVVLYTINTDSDPSFNYYMARATKTIGEIPSSVDITLANYAEPAAESSDCDQSGLPVSWKLWIKKQPVPYVKDIFYTVVCKVTYEVEYLPLHFGIEISDPIGTPNPQWHAIDGITGQVVLPDPSIPSSKLAVMADSIGRMMFPMRVTKKPIGHYNYTGDLSITSF